MRKKTGAIVMTAILAALLVSCGNKDAAQNMAASEAADTAAGTDAKTAGNADAAETSPAEAVSATMDPSAASEKSSAVIINVNSIDSVAKFLSGEWDMTDTLTGDDFGVLTFGGDGACSFKYNGSSAKMNGTVSFTKHSHYDSEKEDLVDDPEVTGFEMNFTEIPGEFALPGLNEVFPTEESVSGYFHTGCGNGEDYLYLDWIGNGDSYVFEYIFQNRDRLEKEYGKDSGHELQTRWFLHRANGGITYPETPKDSEFHAFCWRNPSGNELILEPLELHTNDEYEDYTGRHFSSGYFTPKGDIRLISAKLTEDTDTSLVFDTDRMKNAFPLKMYSFRTDSAGSISAVSDIKESAYGAYDMGDIKPELEYDGMVLKYNGMDYDLTMYGPAANAIMDVQQVGEWILIEGHVNPHVSFYYLLNIYTGNIEKTIEGANLTWMDDDLTTTVYSAYDAVYDFKGSIIGRTDGGEVCELKFAENGSKVKAEDFDGNKFSFDAPEKDAATYRYMSYLRYPSVKNWNAFIDQASDGDVAFAIVNPPMDMVNLLPVQYPDVNKDDSLTGTGTNAGTGADAGTGTNAGTGADAGSNSDAGNSSGAGTGEDLGTGTGIGNDYEEYPEGFYIVALENDTVLRVDSGEPSFSEEGNGFLWNSSSTLDTSKMKKGSVRGYRSVVPEGIPDKCVFISSKGREGMFMVTPISGESNRCGEFIPAK